MAKLLPIDQQPPQYDLDPLPPMSAEEEAEFEAELINPNKKKGPSLETLAELARYAKSGRLGDDEVENL
jgi:hypothetical protein